MEGKAGGRWEPRRAGCQEERGPQGHASLKDHSEQLPGEQLMDLALRRSLGTFEKAGLRPSGGQGAIAGVEKLM